MEVTNMPKMTREAYISQCDSAKSNAEQSKNELLITGRSLLTTIEKSIKMILSIFAVIGISIWRFTGKLFKFVGKCLYWSGDHMDWSDK